MKKTKKAEDLEIAFAAQAITDIFKKMEMSPRAGVTACMLIIEHMSDYRFPRKRKKK